MRSIFKCIENTGINKKYQKSSNVLFLLRQQPFTVQSQRCLKRETSVICPLSPYAIDKFAAERYVLNEYHLHGVPTSAVRFFNVYGLNQNPASPYSGVLSILMDRYIN